MIRNGVDLKKFIVTELRFCSGIRKTKLFQQSCITDPTSHRTPSRPHHHPQKTYGVHRLHVRRLQRFWHVLEVSQTPLKQNHVSAQHLKKYSCLELALPKHHLQTLKVHSMVWMALAVQLQLEGTPPQQLVPSCHPAHQLVQVKLSVHVAPHPELAAQL